MTPCKLLTAIMVDTVELNTHWSTQGEGGLRDEAPLVSFTSCLAAFTFVRVASENQIPELVFCSCQ